MFAEIRLNEKSTVYEAYMKVLIDRKDEFMQKIMVQFRDGAFDDSDPALRERVKNLLRDARLIVDSNVLPDGQRLIDEGKIQNTEEGQYNIAFIKNGLSKDRIYLYLRRDDKIRTINPNRTRQNVNATLYDRDQKMLVRMKGIIESYLESPGPSVTDLLELNDDMVKCSVDVPVEGVYPIPFETNVKPDKIMSEAIKDYDAGRNAVVIKDLSSIGDEEIKTLVMDVDATNNKEFNTGHLMNMEITKLRVTGLSLCASDEYIAEKWMDELRERNWGSDFVSVEQAKTDQEYWSEKLLGRVEEKLILRDEELLENLNGKEAFWGVAAMMDLIPEHGYRKPFYITPTSDFLGEMRKNIFTDSIMPNLKHLVLVDSYVSPESYKVLRKFMGRDDIPITYIMNQQRNRDAKGSHILRKEDRKPDGVNVIWDARDKSLAHSRYMILVENNGIQHIWNPDNSINNFRIKDDKIVTNANIEYRPKSKLQDRYLEDAIKVIR